LLPHPGRSGERLANAEEMLNTASALGSDEDWCIAFLLRQGELLHTGDLMRADASAAALSNAARTTGKAVFGEVFSAWVTMRALIDGRFEEALSGAWRFLNFAEKILPEAAIALFLPGAVTMLRELGRLDEVELIASRSAESQPWLVVSRAALTQIRLGLGDIEGSSAMLRALLAQGFADLMRNVSMPVYVAMLTELCAALDERSHAGELYDLLLPYEPYNLVLGPIAFAGPAARYLGILAKMQGRFTDAEKHFLAALRLSSRTAARPWTAYAEIDYSGMLLERNSSGDRALADGFIASGLKMARALKMNDLVRRAEAVKARLDSPPRERPMADSVHQAPRTRQLDFRIFHQRPEPAALAATAALWPEPNGYTVRNGAIEHADEALEGQANVFKREGDYWTIVFGNKVIRLKHAKGLSMIAWLLQHPGSEFLAWTLERLASGNLVPESEVTDRFVRELSSRPEAGDSGPLLDPTARAAYQRRLKELHENLAEAKSFNDIGRVSQIEEEIDFLSDEICRGVGLRGRARKWPSQIERSRVNVTNAVRAILVKLRTQNPALARYLSNTLKTGRFCTFDPDSSVPTTWIV
jgi:tetratricopeptide (TPR) repeat protein